MPWRECSVMDERMRFVARRLAGEPILRDVVHACPRGSRPNRAIGGSLVAIDKRGCRQEAGTGVAAVHQPQHFKDPAIHSTTHILSWIVRGMGGSTRPSMTCRS
jgi:hypothetical protein